MDETLLQDELEELQLDAAEQVLKKLDPDSATGPDLLPSRILKRYASALSTPLKILGDQIINEGRWPECWILHWILPLHKRNATHDTDNYRGIHLTAQLSKAMERYVGKLFIPYVMTDRVVGKNQFAYREKRGARDLLALLVIKWLSGMEQGKKFVVYCSDVSGAFDRVWRDRMRQKLEAKGLHPKVIRLIMSWLRDRIATILVSGEKSDPITLANIVFQGTVWGPCLWDLFFEDARLFFFFFLHT